MNTSVGRARIGQWYVREGKGEIFLVTGYDERARTIGIQTFDGDLDEIDLRTWTTLLLEFAETPEDWTGPIDNVQFDDLGCTQTELSAAEWFEPLQPFRTAEEVFEETADEGEGIALSEGVPAQELVLDHARRTLRTPRMCFGTKAGRALRSDAGCAREPRHARGRPRQTHYH